MPFVAVSLSGVVPLVLQLQEVVQPPSCCPPDVLPLLTAAQSAQQARDIDVALTLLETAEQTWRSHLQQQQSYAELELSHAGVTSSSEGTELPAVGVLYLAVSAAGCLLSAGRDDEALGVLQGCAEVLAAVHEAGADAAVWHAAAGVAKYHCDDWRVSEDARGNVCCQYSFAGQDSQQAHLRVLGIIAIRHT